MAPGGPRATRASELTRRPTREATDSRWSCVAACRSSSGPGVALKTSILPVTVSPPRRKSSLKFSYAATLAVCLVRTVAFQKFSCPGFFRKRTRSIFGKRFQSNLISAKPERHEYNNPNGKPEGYRRVQLLGRWRFTRSCHSLSICGSLSDGRPERFGRKLGRGALRPFLGLARVDGKTLGAEKLAQLEGHGT